MCSVLYFILRRIKCKVNCNANELAQKKAPKLILMADNYTENKNNILFQFLSELVMRGWFDEIELMFGPVGHTHNGNDAVHRWHNQGVGNHMSYCLAELFQNYKHGWPSHETRPHPIIMDCQFNWKERYAPHCQILKGFTFTGKSADDDSVDQRSNYVRGFLFQTLARNNRTCQLKIKGPDFEDMVWRKRFSNCRRLCVFAPAARQLPTCQAAKPLHDARKNCDKPGNSNDDCLLQRERAKQSAPRFTDNGK